VFQNHGDVAAGDMVSGHGGMGWGWLWAWGSWRSSPTSMTSVILCQPDAKLLSSSYREQTKLQRNSSTILLWVFLLRGPKRCYRSDHPLLNTTQTSEETQGAATGKRHRMVWAHLCACKKRQLQKFPTQKAADEAPSAHMQSPCSSSSSAPRVNRMLRC